MTAIGDINDKDYWQSCGPSPAELAYRKAIAERDAARAAFLNMQNKTEEERNKIIERMCRVEAEAARAKAANRGSFYSY